MPVSLALIAALFALGFWATGRSQEAQTGRIQVVPPGPGVVRAVGLSPDFVHDGLAFVLADG